MLSRSGQRTSSAELSRSFKLPTVALRTGCRPSAGILSALHGTLSHHGTARCLQANVQYFNGAYRH